jgi:hypothetical protein
MRRLRNSKKCCGRLQILNLWKLQVVDLLNWRLRRLAAKVSRLVKLRDRVRDSVDLSVDRGANSPAHGGTGGGGERGSETTHEMAVSGRYPWEQSR